jgi:aspartate 1-decarboxylase
MNIQVLKSKIHKAVVTQAELNYEGSITIDEDLMIASKIGEWEKVLVVNNNNGERLETYVIKGEKGSGVICMNGAAARKVQVGDVLIIMSFASMAQEVADNWTPIRVFVNDKNKQV